MENMLLSAYIETHVEISRVRFDDCKWNSIIFVENLHVIASMTINCECFLWDVVNDNMLELINFG